jgi:hypothetical protein
MMSDDEKTTRAEGIERKCIERLRRFTEKLESREPIRTTVVTVEQTPDGPLTTRREEWI